MDAEKREGPHDGTEPTTIDGNSLTSDGSHRFDPDNSDQLSGSYAATFSGVVETITWDLQKDGAPLRIIDLQFADMKVPSRNAWQEIVEQAGTGDGNGSSAYARSGTTASCRWTRPVTVSRTSR